MGNKTINYNGQLLNKKFLAATAKDSKRIIGQKGSCVAGTAKPEMRDMYILLPLDIDGSMELLKYAARLSVERPQVFRSMLVQLALQVYKASSLVFMILFLFLFLLGSVLPPFVCLADDALNLDAFILINYH